MWTNGGILVQLEDVEDWGRMDGMVTLTFRGEVYEVRAGMTLRNALEKLALNPHMVLGVREGKLITDDTILNEGDEIKLVAVISGG